MEKTKLKIEQSNKSVKPLEDISEDQVCKITRKIVFDEYIGLDKNELIFEIIKMTKCNMGYAELIVQKMKDLGMSVCNNSNMGYAIRRFAEMRGYVTDEEFKKIDKKIQEKTKREDARESKFIEKYGVDKAKWSDEVWNEYEYGDE